MQDSTHSDDGEPPMEFQGAEAVFGMQPAALIEALARQFVGQQMMFAQARKIVAALPAADPRAAEIIARKEKLDRDWETMGLPHHAAALRLALEVLDTYGPQGAEEKDFDAALWNNKYQVWVNEFTP